MDSVMKELRGTMPPIIFGLEPPLLFPPSSVYIFIVHEALS